MKRREWLQFIAGILLFAGSAFWLNRHMSQQHQASMTVERAGACTVPTTVMESTAGPKYFVVMMHGLGANRRVMYPLSRSLSASGARVFVLDLPGHGDNTDSFSFERVEGCAVAVIESLERRRKIQLDRTILVGHSMGGAVAMRLADYFPSAATVAVSPAPMERQTTMPSGLALPFPPPRRLPNNLLIFTAQYDLPYMKPAASKLVELAGGVRHEAEDFRQRRAVQWLTVPYATHTTLIYSRVVGNSSDQWRQMALGQENSSPFSSPDALFNSAALGLLAMMLAFPLAATLLAQALRAIRLPSTISPIPQWRSILLWALAGLIAVSVLNFAVPLRFLKIYNGDYLASCLLFAGIILCVMLWSARNKDGAMKLPLPWRAIAVGAIMGLATMQAFGAWMNWTITDAWLNAARWMRFPVIMLACLPYALAEEWVLGATGAGNWLTKICRYFLFASLRLLIWLSIVVAMYVYANGQILTSVLLFYMSIFSLCARLGADAVHRRTGSPAGAAVFTAILMAWFIAAVFPIT